MFYPEIEPFRNVQMKVSQLHEIFIEQVGNPHGQPIVFVHGGPGGGIAPDYRRFFNPEHYHVILFDQRGCGKSTPHAELQENTTWDLVADMEEIRKYLGLEKWLVFGGSWGSTLSLAYAITHPERVQGLILRGIFLCRPEELKWFYQEGAHRIFPDAWEHYLAPIPPEERRDLISAYHKRLTSPDKDVRVEAARAWSVWEASTSKLIPDKIMMQDFSDEEFALAFARIECHYFVNSVFFKSPNWILENVHKLKNIPMDIVHGRYDVVCPIESAWSLKRACPHAQLHIIPSAGHSALEAGIREKLIEITNRYQKASS